MRSHTPLPLVFVGCAFALLSGCLDLDEQFLVHDLRILAVKTEPAEIVLDASYAVSALAGGFGGPGGAPGGAPTFGAEGFDVDIEVFAYDPRAGLVTMTTFLCPDGVDSSCADYDAQAEVLDDVTDPAELAEREAVFLPSRASAEADDINADPIGRVPLPLLQWDLTPSVVSALTENAFGSAAIGVETIEPRIVVELETAADEGVTYATAFKRIPIIWDLHDPALGPTVQAAIAPYGIELCDVDLPLFEEEGPAPCARVREANKNPLLLGFDIVDELAEEGSEGDRPAVREALDPQLGPRPTLLVEPGGVLTIRPVFAPGSIEKYQVIVSDPETEKITVEDRFEDFSAHWFVTRGSTQLLTQGWTSGIGAPGQDVFASLDGRWQLPTASELAGLEPEEGGFGFGGPPGAEDDVAFDATRDSLVVVIKDQRGGTTVGQINVEYAR